MRRSLAALNLLVVLSLPLAGCTEDIIGIGAPAAPAGLTYQLQPSGDPASPNGIILRWDAVTDPDLDVYHVYSRGSANGSWGLRGSTTSTSFHDEGVPHLQYYVTAVNVDGNESDPSDYVEVDERLRLPAPLTLTSISLDAAIHLQWSDNAYQSAPSGFDYYRVYSASYDLDNNLCGTGWVLEGTTVSPSFLVDGISNGVPRCFAVSAISIEGFESLWSPLRYDTPRPGGRNILLYTQAGDPTRAGFRFFRDLNNDGLVSRTELGLVGQATDTSMDLILTLDGSGNVQLTPKRLATDLRTYTNAPITDLESIDIAPASGYARTPLLATPLWGYVFRMNEGDGFYRYGSLRVSAAGTNYVIFDWAYQTDRGNPELIRVAR